MKESGLDVISRLISPAVTSIWAHYLLFRIYKAFSRHCSSLLTSKIIYHMLQCVACFQPLPLGGSDTRMKPHHSGCLCLQLQIQWTGWVQDGSPWLLPTPASCFPCGQLWCLSAEAAVQEMFVHQNVPPLLIWLQKLFAFLIAATARSTPCLRGARWRMPFQKLPNCDDFISLYLFLIPPHSHEKKSLYLPSWFFPSFISEMAR